MRLTTKGRYAVTAMTDLALHEHENGGRPVALGDIAERQSIPVAYLGRLFVGLRRYGLVKSSRGPGGGYRLARSARDISVADMIEAVDENLDNTRCQGQVNCQGSHKCLTHVLWSDLNRRIQDVLSDVRLFDVVSDEQVLAVAERQDARAKSIKARAAGGAPVQGRIGQRGGNHEQQSTTADLS